jgi:hypothetical protein
MDKNKMKKNHYITIAFCLILSTSKAQTTLHDSLCNLNKIQLTKIYIEEVKRVNSKMFKLPLKDINGSVPESKYTKTKFNFIDKKLNAFNESITTHFYEIIPYADSNDLINSIIYLKNQ